MSVVKPATIMKMCYIVTETGHWGKHWTPVQHLRQLRKKVFIWETDCGMDLGLKSLQTYWIHRGMGTLGKRINYITESKVKLLVCRKWCLHLSSLRKIYGLFFTALLCSCCQTQLWHHYCSPMISLHHICEPISLCSVCFKCSSAILTFRLAFMPSAFFLSLPHPGHIHQHQLIVDFPEQILWKLYTLLILVWNWETRTRYGHVIQLSQYVLKTSLSKDY